VNKRKPNGTRPEILHRNEARGRIAAWKAGRIVISVARGHGAEFLASLSDDGVKECTVLLDAGTPLVLTLSSGDVPNTARAVLALSAECAVIVGIPIASAPPSFRESFGLSADESGDARASIRAYASDPAVPSAFSDLMPR
jgi:hypothetical protein